MRFLRYLTVAAFAAAALAVAASSVNSRTYIVYDSTSDPAETRDADGNVLKCTSTLQAKCNGETTWVDVSGTLDVVCPVSDPGVAWREKTEEGSQENTAWDCPLTGSGVPSGAVAAKQAVAITGVLTSCAVSNLTAQNACRYYCLDKAEKFYECEDDPT